jgi:hypothetical protein
MIIHCEIIGYDKKLEIRIVSYNGRVDHTNIHIRIKKDVPHEPPHIKHYSSRSICNGQCEKKGRIWSR